MIPLKINGKHLCEIFDPSLDISTWTDQQIIDYSIGKQMFPTEVQNTSETYSRNTERTADYELKQLVLVNRKAKPEFTWRLIHATYVENLMRFLGYNYNFKNDEGAINPKEAPTYSIEYYDYVGMRTINTYLGQTIEGTLVEYQSGLFWENFRIAFPER